MDSQSPAQQRPHHRRNASSKSNLLKSLVSPRSRPEPSEASIPNPRKYERTKSVPLLPADHPHTGKAKVLGERQGNVQSPPSSPSKSRQESVAVSKTSKVPVKDAPSSPKKSKSSTNLSAAFAKLNRSSKDLSAQDPGDKENTTPPSSSNGPADTPIWAQFASNGTPSSRPSTRDSKSSNNIQDEIEKYTPQNYSPSKQRNFNGSFDQPSLRPTLRSRPQSAFILGADSVAAALGRRASVSRSSTDGRRSEDVGRRQSRDQQGRRDSGNRAVLAKSGITDRKVSGSSTEQVPLKERLNIAKRGGRVMAAVAALQGKSKTEPARDEPQLDPKAVDEAFEAVLISRNIAEPMRQKMRSLTLRVKADFVRQDQGSKTASNSPTGTVNAAASAAKTEADADSAVEVEDDSKATKRSRPRSRTFTFSKADKRGDASPSKKQRSQSKSRPVSIHIPTETPSSISPTTPTAPKGSLGRKAASSAIPADYISYLHKHQDPTTIELGRLHKLRILLRNETVAWVDSFITLGGMTEIVGLLHRVMALEWREEHEDQLLHEALLCLKGLCTTERAMIELDSIADQLFPALLGMLFDDEKKGPAEYTTRTIVVNVLCKSRSLCIASNGHMLI